MEDLNLHPLLKRKTQRVRHPAGAAIEERSFVAKGAPLDDGQRRGSMAAAAIVTVKSWVMWAALPTLAEAARMGALRFKCEGKPRALEADPSLRSG
jgi:hypothetical protein